MMSSAADHLGGAVSERTAGSVLVQLETVSKVYGSGDVAVHALSHVDLTVTAGAFVVVLGPSGSGKTTLLNLMGGIELPTDGHVRVDGVDLTSVEPKALTAFRRDHVGFVFQFFNLIPTLTARENVGLIAELTGSGDDARADDLLRGVGLGDRLDHFPGMLSGGEQQRVAIARALVKDPRLLLCDEPTGALDLETGRAVLGLLRQVNRERGCTVVLVTHNSAIARMADKVLEMRSGRLEEERVNPAPAAAEALRW
jgi:putative ABC transport system ATP-binding protein